MAIIGSCGGRIMAAGLLYPSVSCEYPDPPTLHQLSVRYVCRQHGWQRSQFLTSTYLLRKPALLNYNSKLPIFTTKVQAMIAVNTVCIHMIQIPAKPQRLALGTPTPSAVDQTVADPANRGTMISLAVFTEVLL